MYLYLRQFAYVYKKLHANANTVKYKQNLSYKVFCGTAVIIVFNPSVRKIIRFIGLYYYLKNTCTCYSITDLLGGPRPLCKVCLSQLKCF